MMMMAVMMEADRQKRVAAFDAKSANPRPTPEGAAPLTPGDRWRIAYHGVMKGIMASAHAQP